MDRRAFLSATASGSVVASASAASTDAAQTVRIVAADPVFAPAAEALARHITACGAGLAAPLRAEALGTAGSNTGDHEISLGWSPGAEAHPAMALFGPVPAGMTGEEHRAWLDILDGQTLWDALAADLGAKPFLFSVRGIAAGLWLADGIATPEDLAGQTVRAEGLAAAAFRALGAVPVDRGAAARIAVAGEAAADLEARLADTFPRLVGPGVHDPTGAVAAAARLDWWRGLSDVHRAAVEASIRAAGLADEAEALRRNAFALGMMTDTSVETLPEPLLTALMRAAEEAVTAEVATDALGERVLESYRRARRETAGWSGAADGDFIAARGRVLGL
ncbi:MAG: hypothetical protein ACFBSD_16705 [Paracoccaceae bacterium]